MNIIFWRILSALEIISVCWFISFVFSFVFIEANQIMIDLDIGWYFLAFNNGQHRVELLLFVFGTNLFGSLIGAYFWELRERKQEMRLNENIRLFMSEVF